MSFFPQKTFTGSKIIVLASLNLLPRTFHSTALTRSFQPPQLRSLRKPVFQDDGQMKQSYHVAILIQISNEPGIYVTTKFKVYDDKSGLNKQKNPKW